MKRLTIKPKLGYEHIEQIEILIAQVLPDNLKKILLLYASSQVLEDMFYDQDGEGWNVASFWSYDGIYGLTKEFKEEGFGIKVPFAHDRGGWSYCVSLNAEDYNCVYVYRFTDHAPEEAFLKIADSFEEFIDGLEPERLDE